VTPDGERTPVVTPETQFDRGPLKGPERITHEA
jgi:hypothetical protein